MYWSRDHLLVTQILLQKATMNCQLLPFLHIQSDRLQHRWGKLHLGKQDKEKDIPLYRIWKGPLWGRPTPIPARVIPTLNPTPQPAPTYPMTSGPKPGPHPTPHPTPMPKPQKVPIVGCTGFHLLYLLKSPLIIIRNCRKSQLFDAHLSNKDEPHRWNVILMLC